MEHIDEVIFLKIIENRADDTERRIFKRWIETSEMHAEAFEQFKKTYHITSINTNKQTNWEAVKQKFKEGTNMPSYIELPRKKISVFKLSVTSLMRVAAVFLVALGVSFLVKIIVFDPGQLTVSGKNLKPHEPYYLADSSRVFLNGNSEITFSKQFGTNNREVLLTGEAFFEVRRNEDMPFIISTHKTKTQVLGTSFNVYSDVSGNVKVSVVKGIVAFYSENPEHGVKLKAGDQALYNASSAKIEKQQNTDLNFLSWKTGILYFNETPITEVFQLLQKQYSHVFVFETKNGIMPTLTTTIDNQSEEAVLEELNLLLNTKNVISHDTIFFKPIN